MIKLGMTIRIVAPPLENNLSELLEVSGKHTKIGNTIMAKLDTGTGGKKFTDPMGYSTLPNKQRGDLDSSGGAGRTASPPPGSGGPNPGPLEGASSGAPAANLRSPKKAGVLSGNPNKKD